MASYWLEAEVKAVNAQRANFVLLTEKELDAVSYTHLTLPTRRTV